MSKQNKEILEFGEFRLDGAEALLTRHGTPVALPPRVFDLLFYMASNAGRLIEKEEILKALWPDSFVEESNLTVNVAALRRALGPAPEGQAWIETVPKRGYRFLATVTRTGETPAPAAAAEPPNRPARRNRKYLAIPAVPAVLLLTAAGVWWYLPKRPPAATDHQQSIAVLPFQDLSSGDGDLHAGLGMADCLITRLGALPQLTVRPIATVLKYDGVAVDPLEAGRALRVDTVLTGSIQHLDKRIRVNVRLLRVQDGESLFADKYDEFLTNIFAVQDAISEKLAKVLALRLTSEDQDRMMRRYTENTEAFRVYELGRYERYSNRSVALDYYQRSIRLDPRFALPFIELTNIYVGQAGNGIAAFRENAPLAQQAAAAALRLAPDLAEAHVAAADVKRFIDRDFAGARGEVETALRLNRGSPKVHAMRGWLLAMEGELSEAVQEARSAAHLDPFNAQINDDLVWILICARNYQAALDSLDSFEQRDARPHIDWNRFYVYLKLSRVGEAIDLMESALKADPSNHAILAVLAHGYAAAGRRRDAQDLLRRLPNDWGFYQRAVAEIALGDLGVALTHLDQSVDERSVWAEWLKVDPDLDPVRSDPRFAKIVTRAGLTL